MAFDLWAMFKEALKATIIAVVWDLAYHAYVAYVNASKWKSEYAGWRQRTLPAPPELATFIPNLLTLCFAVVRDSPSEKDELILALFTHPMENPANCWFIAINCLGMRRIVAAPDAMRFIALGTNARQMPSTGVLGNTWVVKELEPSQTTYRIIGNMNYNNLHPEYVGPDLRETCVQGFSKESRKLVARTLEVDKLPESLWELLGLALEARDIEGAEKPENRNNEVLNQVKEVLEAECLRE